ncbi:DNA-protecting protein DprA, partial [Candidatus Uhrbacteria bacterium]|nr:DNA-protecting protein DprA [Candidatus Uhrbacteria bacterium]MBD3284368.1 DNA-protecting protein DprA [Candidatus Uhrbacteria bacterium]
PGTPTLPYQFLHRNRIVSGLSDLTIIIEADHDSGALVTAKLALEQGREVLAVPGSIWSQASRGVHALIRQGARPCTTMDDIYESLNLHAPETARQADQIRNVFPVDQNEQRILDLLTQPMDTDHLVRESGWTTARLSTVLSMLELKGRIINVGPRTYVKASSPSASSMPRTSI